MLHKNLNDVLNRLGWTRDGDAWLSPQGHQSSVFLARSGNDHVVVDAVARIEFGTETAIITTTRKERFGVEHDEIRAIRTLPDGAR
jgi:hypothetical protein